MMKKILIIPLVIFLILSCKENTHYVYSPDRKQCITIKDFYNERYIIIGKMDILPDTNFVRLQTDPKVKMNDEFVGCWGSTNSKLELIINDAVIMENKLDTSKFTFSSRLPIDGHGIPTLEGFSENGCFHFGFSSFSVLPENGALIE